MASCGGVEIGDSVLYKGRRSLVRGFTMKSSSTQYVALEDEESGEHLSVPLDEVEALGERRLGAVVTSAGCAAGASGSTEQPDERVETHDSKKNEHSDTDNDQHN